MYPVSIIIPVHNRSNELERAILSVLAQTYQEFEIIVVDDGSTDSPEEVYRRCQDSRIKFYSIPHSGVSAARNFGVEKSSYEHIAFLDSDDEWLPEKLESQIDALQKNPQYIICYTGESWIRNGQPFPHRKSRRKFSGWVFDHCLEDCFIGCSTMLMEKRLFCEVGGFDAGLPVCEDYDLWLKISAKYPMLLVPDQLIRKHGGHSDQLSNRFWGKDRFRLSALCNLIGSGILSDAQRQAVSVVFLHKCTLVAGGCLKRNRYKEFAYYVSLLQQKKCLEISA